jgi:hypothetical protein
MTTREAKAVKHDTGSDGTEDGPGGGCPVRACRVYTEMVPRAPQGNSNGQRPPGVATIRYIRRGCGARNGLSVPDFVSIHRQFGALDDTRNGKVLQN